MKTFIILFAFCGLLAGCSNNGGGNEEVTADSAFVFPPDTNVSGMDTDNHNVPGSLSIALDSAGPTIRPEDTVRH